MNRPPAIASKARSMAMCQARGLREIGRRRQHAGLSPRRETQRPAEIERRTARAGRAPISGRQQHDAAGASQAARPEPIADRDREHREKQR